MSRKETYKSVLENVKSELLKNLLQIFSLTVLSLRLMTRRWILTSFSISLPILSILAIWMIQEFYEEYLFPDVNESLETGPGAPGWKSPPVYSFPEVQYIVRNVFNEDIPRRVFFEQLDSVSVGFHTDDGKKKGFLGNLTEYFLPVSGDLLRGTYFDEEVDVPEEYYKILHDMEHEDKYNDIVGAVYFHDLISTQFNYTIQVESEHDRKYEGLAFNRIVENMDNNHTMITSKFCVRVGQVTGLFSCDEFIMHHLMNTLNSQFIMDVTGRIVYSKLAQTPYYSPDGYVLQNQMGDILLLRMTPMVVLFVLPFFLFTLVTDKETKSRELLDLMGMRLRNYIIVNFSIFVVYCWLFLGVYHILGAYIFKFRLFTQISPSIYLVVYLGISLSVPSFCFTMSAFFQSSFLSSLVGFIVSITIPSMTSSWIEALTDDGAYWQKFYLMIPPLPVCDVLNRLHLLVYTDNVSLGFDFLYKNGDVLCAMIGLFLAPILNMILFLYLEAVIPQNFGTRKHPLFFLRWKKKKKLIPPHKRKKMEEIPLEDEEDSEVRAEKLLIQNKLSGEKAKKLGVVLKGITKTYGSKTVVNELFLQIPRNQCFGLLGQNGAGKSTTISMLVGTVSMTRGRAFVAGQDVQYQMKKIRRNIGICPQHSILYKELTTREHLHLYCGIRGIPLLKQKAHLTQIMKQTGLLESDEVEQSSDNRSYWTKFLSLFQLQRNSMHNLSEGVQRKTAIAISLIGNPEILFLDEPTTGLSVEAKKCVWNIILEQKKSRTIVLTTHSMLEADILSDRIGIMAHGKFLCLGSSLHLKEKFGKGYNLNINYFPEIGGKQEIVSLVNELIPKFVKKRIIKDFPNLICWEIENHPSLRLSTIFETIEEAKLKKGAQYGIMDFSMNQTSLEDVFIGLVKEDFVFIEEIKKENESLKEQNEVLMKHIQNLESSRDDEEKLSAEESITIPNDDLTNPSLFDGTTSKFDSIAPSGEGEEDTSKAIESNVFKFYLLQSYVMLKKQLIYVLRNPAGTFFQLGLPIIITMVIYSIFRMNAMGDTKDLNQAVTEIGDFPKCHPYYGGNESLFCYDFVFSTNNNDFAAQIMDELTKGVNMRDYDDDDSLDEEEYYSWREFATGVEMIAWMKHNPNRTNIGVNFTESEIMEIPIEVIVFNQNMTFIIQKNYTEYTLFVNATSLNYPNGDLAMSSHHMKLMIDNTILYLETNDNETLINVSSMNIPLVPRKTRFIYSILNLTLPTLYTLCNMFVVVFCVVYLVSEIESEKIEFMRINGLRSVSMVVGYGTQFIILTVLCCLISAGFSYILGIPVFTQSFGVTLFAMVLYSMALLVYCLLFSVVFKKQSTMMSAMILFAIIVYLIGALFDPDLVSSIYSKDLDWFELIMYYIVLPLLFPPLNMAKIFADVMAKSLPIYNYDVREYEDNVGFGFMDLFERQKKESMGFDTPATYIWILFLVADAVFYIFCGFLIVWVKKRRYFGAKKDVEYYKENANDGKSVDDGHSISMYDVSKKYNMTKRELVLSGVNLNIKSRACTCVIGPNASGKTTTLNLLNSKHRISGGDVYVNEVNIKEYPSFCRRLVGFLPQLSILYENMTACEILELYGCLKGLKRDVLASHIDTCLKAVNLHQNKNDRVGTFSGGMKRRMAVCIAIIGSPIIWLLDEPTTGLDPFSKNLVWRTVMENKKSKAILLTSHEMDECEILSDEIAILNAGKIQAKGTVFELKQEYDTGYNISLISVRGKEQKLMDFILSVCPKVSLVSQHNNFFVYNLPKSNLKELIELLKQLEERKSRNEEPEDVILTNYGVSQTDLMDVYQKVVYGRFLGYADKERDLHIEENYEQDENNEEKKKGEVVVEIEMIEMEGKSKRKRAEDSTDSSKSSSSDDSEEKHSSSSSASSSGESENEDLSLFELAKRRPPKSKLEKRKKKKKSFRVDPTIT